MLNETKVLYYIKENLGFPHVDIEKSDEQLMMYVKMFSLSEFSNYVPDVFEWRLLTDRPKIKVEGTNNMFYILDPDGCDILNVVAVIPAEAESFYYGYPYMSYQGSFDGVADMLLQIDQAETLQQFSRGDQSFDYFPPNKIRIFPSFMNSQKYVVRYERVHPEHFMTIPQEYSIDFLNLALADAMMNCGTVRSKYSNITTPFGEIPLNTTLKDQGSELKQRTIEKLKSLPPNLLVYVG